MIQYPSPEQPAQQLCTISCFSFLLLCCSTQYHNFTAYGNKAYNRHVSHFPLSVPNLSHASHFIPPFSSALYSHSVAHSIHGEVLWLRFLL